MNVHICISPAYRMARRWNFEDHAYCGPVLLDARGEPTHELLDREDHPFWGHYARWQAQGKRVDAKGHCIVTWGTKA